MFAAEIRKKRVDRMRAFTHWRWRLDEVCVKINGEMHSLWRAVDHEGEVLESFASRDRDKAAALEFMKRLMKRHGKAEAITTDGLRSYKAAMKDIGNTGKQEVAAGPTTGWRTAPALPTKGAGHEPLPKNEDPSGVRFSQRTVHNPFNQERHLTDRETYKANRSAALAEWRTVMA